MAEVRQNTAGSVFAGPLSHIKECRLETEGKGNCVRAFKEERMGSDLYKKAPFGYERRIGGGVGRDIL